MTDPIATEPLRFDSFDGTSISFLAGEHIDDRARPLVVCAHGFPDSPQTWRHLLPRLTAAGYRVAAPFLRGYAPSGVPDDGCVQTAASSADLIALHEHLGADERAVLIGHDWGAPIVYGAAALEPSRWAKVIGMAVPPGSALGTAFLTDTAQLKRSWYMFFFQHPLADLVVPADDLAFIDMIWNDWSPGYDASVDLPHVKAALREPANLAAAIGYYRATLGGVGLRDDLAEAQAATQAIPAQPMLYLHGEHDGCIGIEVAAIAQAEAGEHVRFETVADAAHFLQLEQPDTVNDLIVEFLA
ncbi:alpha/beta fold hydrolase [Ilumatobacter coccineus]|uniref:Putative hydrolase n=1 Tax=Ilumatobacter coccineus (strain NBRC 103263 / KCTC 29153 / YM16-304) TaxID=1313172 RepID=A0A6C7E5P5_ILUCY|nr:alpha/beta hydrolase [Ilumatobacter coccineus]BAN01783.1 putative hydrolase [Ilumatobacter coccineus YM16-304]